MIKRILGILLCIVVLLVVLRNFWLKASIEQGIFAVTGAPLKIKRFDLKLFQPEVAIEGMTMYNPKGFPDKVMASVPEIYVKYDPSAMLKGFLHFKEVRFKLEEFTVVRSDARALNIDALKALEPPKGDGPPPKFQIDILDLEIGKVAYKDYSTSATPSVKEFPVGIKEKFTNIGSPQDLVKLVVFRALSKTPIAALANFDLNQLKDSFSSAIEGAGQGLIDKAVGTVQEKLKQLPWGK